MSHECCSVDPSPHIIHVLYSTLPNFHRTESPTHMLITTGMALQLCTLKHTTGPTLFHLSVCKGVQMCAGSKWDTDHTHCE